MNIKEEKFLGKLRETFKVEAEERLQAISSGLIEVEKKSSADEKKEIMETIFREAHSLKGAARSVNLTDIETICQSLEDVFRAMKNLEIQMTAELFDEVHRSTDTIVKIISGNGVETSEISGLLKVLDGLKTEGTESWKSNFLCMPVPHQDIDPGSQECTETGGGSDECSNGQSSQMCREKTSAETIRIPVHRLDSLLMQTEEMLSVKLTIGQQTDEIKDVSALLEPWRKEWEKLSSELRSILKEFKRKGNGRSDNQSVKLSELIVSNQAYMKSMESKVARMTKSSEHNSRWLGGMVDNLLEDMKKSIMLPFSSFLDIVPKLIRDLSRDQGKEVELVIQGGEIEVDKRILEEMKDPLIHLLRNCIDHGIEKPDERRHGNKPPKGTITITVSQVDSNKVEINIADDGSGIEQTKIKEAALKRKIVSEAEAEAFAEEEVMSLIFQSEFSTSAIVTDISGRGLGLAIVKENVEKLGGTVSLQTEAGKGTAFRILLPLTLATFKGVIVSAAGQLFVVPSSKMESVVRIKNDEIRTTENRETISLNNRPLSVARLDTIMELPVISIDGETGDYLNAMVLGTGENRIAFIVDEVIEEKEVLVKGLGKQLSRVRNIGGATVLGSGKVVPILNVSDLLKSAVKLTGAPEGKTRGNGKQMERKKTSLMVAEDSVTSRMLLKNILESAGYDVRAVVDGAEAFTALKEGTFDLLVSDIEMPRLNGFDLTEKIRGDRKLAELPVVLVSALSSREDKERGIDVGANAYIVKSSFEQSNLLDVIKRLI